MNIESVVDIAIDNNCIDRIVTKHRPTHVIIEALWVVPTKFVILCQLHPTVKWIIRFHSDMPFIACEGTAMSWIFKYSLFKNIIIGINSPRFLREIRVLIKIKNRISDSDVETKVIYLPNYYPTEEFKSKVIDRTKDVIDICCL